VEQAMERTKRKFFNVCLILITGMAVFLEFNVQIASGVFSDFNSYSPFIFKAPQTPTPTPQPPHVFVLSNDFSFVSSSGSLHVLGEIKNDSPYNLSDVAVKVRLLNRNDNEVASLSDSILLSNLPAGERTCFDILFISPPSNWSKYKFDTPTFDLNGADLPDLSLLNIDSSYDDKTGDYKINGEVHNDESSRVEMVKPVATLYQKKTGKVIGCAYDYVDSIYLNAGSQSPFSIDFYGRKYSDVDSFRIQVDGNIR
jgi:hypothetical protein